MTKKVTKRTRRRLFLVTLLTLSLMIVFSFNLWKMVSQVLKENTEANALKKNISDLHDKEAYLKVEVEKLNDPDYVARYAREKYLYSRNGEFTIRISGEAQ